MHYCIADAKCVADAMRRGGGRLDLPALPPPRTWHGYGVHAIASGVPLDMPRKWMGHASTETAAIYADALGAEEQGIDAPMWGGGN